MFILWNKDRYYLVLVHTYYAYIAINSYCNISLFSKNCKKNLIKILYYNHFCDPVQKTTATTIWDVTYYTMALTKGLTLIKYLHLYTTSFLGVGLLPVIEIILSGFKNNIDGEN